MLKEEDVEQECVVLSERLRATGKFYAPRLAPEHLETAIRERRAVVKTVDGEPVAFAALWSTNREDWLELGTVWVAEGHRGNGLRHTMMAIAAELASPNKKIFLMTDVEGVMKSAKVLGLTPMTTASYPRLLRWASEVGAVCRLPGSIHPVSPGIWGCPKDKERWLFIGF